MKTHFLKFDEEIRNLDISPASLRYTPCAAISSLAVQEKVRKDNFELQKRQGVHL